MISLKRLLQEQAEVEYEITAELQSELLEAIDQEEDPLALLIAGNYWGAFLAFPPAQYATAAVVVTLAAILHKPLKLVGSKFYRVGAYPIRIIGKQLALQAPWKVFLRLNDAGAADWTRNAILKPLQRVKSLNSPTSEIYKEADRLEGLIKSNTETANFSQLALKTRKMFKSETYNALRKLRNSEGRAYINTELQLEFEKLFGELQKINPDIFNEHYIRTTLNCLDISMFIYYTNFFYFPQVSSTDKTNYVNKSRFTSYTKIWYN